MPISMTQHAPGMPRKAYDETMAHVAEPLRQSDGFISHTAQITADGVTVTEVWDTREQWELWYTTSVMPHLPNDAPSRPSPTSTTPSPGNRRPRPLEERG